MRSGSRDSKNTDPITLGSERLPKVKVGHLEPGEEELVGDDEDVRDELRVLGGGEAAHLVRVEVFQHRLDMLRLHRQLQSALLNVRRSIRLKFAISTAHIFTCFGLD